MQLIRTSVLVAPVLILLLFASTLLGVDRLGFRDAGHFYAPLFDYVADRCASQWLPLWNPLDQTGMPLAGETTTAVFYPVRYTIYWLPISRDAALAWYVVFHLLLASIAARVAARWCGMGPLPASVAGIVYPLSGSVLFLYANPTYLVGAAWAPLAAGALLTRSDVMQKTRVLVAAIALAMMVLGGDPQTALHVMIMVVIVAAARMIRRRRESVSWIAIVAAAALAAALSAPQLAASISWTRLSERVHEHENIEDGLFDPPVTTSRRYNAFQYSLAPWHTIELATPNAFGSLFPINRRVSRLIAGDGRMWTPSIYMGMLVLLALLDRLCRIPRSGIDAWTAMAMLSLFLAMGHFGVAWWIQSTTGTLANVDSAAGGPYWFFYHFVPRYDSFRYPAKWLTLFALAASIITARMVEEGFDYKRLGRLMVAVAVALVAGAAVVLWIRWNPESILVAPLPHDEFWGPLEVDSGLSQILWSLIYSAVVLAAIALVVRLQQRRGWSKQRVSCCLLLVVVADLGICGYGSIARVSRQDEHELLAKLDPPPPRSAESRWMRTQSAGGWPQNWKQTSSDHRLLDVEASGRAAWFGRWHLADGTAVMNNMVSIRSRSIAQFWLAMRRATSGLSGAEQTEFWQAIRRWLAIEGVVHSSGESIRITVDWREAVVVDRDYKIERLLPQRSMPTAGSPLRAHFTLRAHGRWQHDESLDLASDAFADHLRSIWQSGAAHVPVVQAAGESNAGAGSIKTDAMIGSDVPGVPEQSDYAVELAAPTLLTRAVFQDGHWKAWYAAPDSNQWNSLPVHRVDHLTQGVILPRGDWTLSFRYSPWWLGWSILTAMIAWIAVGMVVIVRRIIIGKFD